MRDNNRKKAKIISYLPSNSIKELSLYGER